jgi:hypothetical protein
LLKTSREIRHPASGLLKEPWMTNLIARWRIKFGLAEQLAALKNQAITALRQFTQRVEAGFLTAAAGGKCSGRSKNNR